MEALGRAVDISLGVINTDVQAGPATGNRIHLRRFDQLSIVLLAGFTGAVDPLNVTLREHNAVAAGVSQNLAIIDHYYLKTKAPALLGNETWAKVTQLPKAATLTAFGTAAEQKLMVIEVNGDQLSDGFEWVSLDIPDQGAAVGTKVASVLYVMADLNIQRAPANLSNPQA